MGLPRNLKIESVSRLNPTPPLRVEPEQTVAEAVAIMRRERVGCLLVGMGQQIVGVFTERDLMKRVLAENHSLDRPISDFMTPNPVVVQASEAIHIAIRKMEEGGYRHLPVVDGTGRAVGVLSVKRIVHYLVEHFPGTVYNLPPNPANVPQEREGA
jgi:CBS domain-containing protein